MANFLSETDLRHAFTTLTGFTCHLVVSSVARKERVAQGTL
jgi:hypothetical protein